MKYFTQQWCWADLSTQQVEKISKSYDNYTDSIYAKLPFPLKLLAKSICLHDGLVKKLTFTPAEKNLALSGIFGDLAVGYFKMRIEYKCVLNFNLNEIFNVFAKKKIEILRDEIEVSAKITDEWFDGTNTI